MRAKQRGATFLGMVIIFAIVGVGVYAGIRLVPIYVEYMAVVRALEQTAKEYSGAPVTVSQVRISLDRRWTIEDIKSISPNDIEIRKVGNGTTMRAFYRAEAPFIGNVSLVADFDKTVEIHGN
jgi:hypothetical protein